MEAAAELKFSIGSSSDGDVLLDELLLVSSSKRRVPIKSRKKGLSKADARLALQKSVASRSSALRQGKFAHARTGNGGEEAFPAAKADESKARSEVVTLVGKKLTQPNSKVSKLKFMLPKKLK